MRNQSFLSTLFLLGLAQAKPQLRQRPDRRALEITESVPFDAAVSIKVSDEVKDNEPTPEDYHGAVNGFETWFHHKAYAFFTDNSDYAVTYIETACQWNQDATTYTPDGVDSMHHYISISCEAWFKADSADAIPTSSKLGYEGSHHFPLQTFIPTYLIPSSPSSSPFRSTRSMGLRFIPVYGSGSGQTPPSTGGQTPAGPNGQETPADPGDDSGGEPSTPANDPDDGSGAGQTDPSNDPPPVDDVGSQTTTGTIPIIIQWSLAIGEGDRIPDSDEYIEFMADVEGFLRDILFFFFHEDQTGLAKFTGAIDSHMVSHSYNAAKDLPHTITIHMDAEFELGMGEQYPNMLLWVLALRYTGIEKFRQNYLALTPGLFQNPSRIQYRALD